MTYRQQLDKHVRFMNITNYSMLAVIVLSLIIGPSAKNALGQESQVSKAYVKKQK